MPSEHEDLQAREAAIDEEVAELKAAEEKVDKQVTELYDKRDQLGWAIVVLLHERLDVVDRQKGL